MYTQVCIHVHIYIYINQFYLRKLWSRYNFKSIVSPQDLLQEISVASKKRFNIGVQAEAADLLTWLLAGLHTGLKFM
jgi:U4/U6.U5 tri-snRNP-associated protein 2